MTQQQAPSSDPLFTLDAFRTDGRATLATNQIPLVKEVAVREVDITALDGSQVTTLRSDSLYGHPDATGQHPDPLPVSGKLTRAIFEFFFSDSTHSRVAVLVELIPPNTLRIHSQSQAHVSAILAWFHASLFSLSQTAPGTLAAIVLALALATAAAFDDNDSDDDDEDARLPHPVFTLAH